MYVVTADQRASTRTGDHVDELLASLRPWATTWEADIVLELERTVGDEVQAVLRSANAAVDLSLLLMRLHEWSVGIGVGEVNEPLRASSRESSGDAFVRARRAVERARGKAEPVPLVVAGSHPDGEEAATAVLQILASVVRRRSAAGWEVFDLWAPGVTQKDIADTLGISTQAVSQRVASAMLDEERRARPVAATLLEQASSQEVRQ